MRRRRPVHRHGGQLGALESDRRGGARERRHQRVAHATVQPAPGGWDAELLEISAIPARVLPEIRPSSGDLRIHRRQRVPPDRVPVASLIGDSHAALFGQAAFEPGAVKATYGTGSSLMTLVRAARSAHGLSTTVAWAFPDRTVLRARGQHHDDGRSGRVAGPLLGAAHTAAERRRPGGDGGRRGRRLCRARIRRAWRAALGRRRAWTDLRADARHDRRAPGAGHDRVDRVSGARRVRGDAVGPVLPVTALLADGGASRNDALMQFQADILGCPVVRNSSADLSALGAAWLAGLAVGVWRSLEASRALPRATDRFEPRWRRERDARYAGWVDAVSRRARAHGRHHGPS